MGNSDAPVTIEAEARQVMAFQIEVSKDRMTVTMKIDRQPGQVPRFPGKSIPKQNRGGQSREQAAEGVLRPQGGGGAKPQGKALQARQRPFFTHGPDHQFYSQRQHGQDEFFRAAAV